MSLEQEVPTADPKEAAKEARLRYVTDISPGIRRVKKGNGFSYVHPDGKTVSDETTLARIRGLVIPPAWTDVWICTHPRGHLQATGRDAKGRKQYRYHTDWRAVRDSTKYDKLTIFGKLLPKIRSRVADDLKRRGLPREKVLAAVVRILDLTHIRIGNEEYARENNSFGLTTLRSRHVDVDGSTVRFRFRGKSGQQQDLHFRDPRIARVIRRCEELPGHELFGYVDDDGNAVDVESQHVNDYLREATGEEITAKDFRTWGGTVQATACLMRAGECDTELQTKHCMTDAVKQVADVLGNRPATCRKYYIDPRVFSAYQRRHLCGYIAKELTKHKEYDETSLQPIEKAVLKLLEETLD